jgi:hypothetical protein
LSAKFGESFVKKKEKKGALWSSVIGIVVIVVFLIIYLFLK